MAPVHYDPSEDVHPAPWISSLADKLVKDHGLSITFLNYQPRLPSDIIQKEQGGMKYVFLKSPVPKMDHLGFFKKRVSILKNYLLEHRSEYDLIHIHGSEHQYEAAVAGTGIPHVLSMQGVISECLKKLTKKWDYTHLNWWMSSKYEKKYVPQITDFICRTHFDSGFVKEMNPGAKIHENWEMIREEFFQDLGSDIPKRLLYMGGTHPIKGIQLMLPAFNEIRKKHDVKLQILGSADASAIAALIEKEGLSAIQEGDIELLGFQDVNGVVRAMNSSYALVHTSLIDNSPNSVCEAQVAGLPVVSTNVGGISSLIEHGKTGLLTQTNASDIAEKVCQLIENKELHSKIKHESKAMARPRHDGNLIAERTLGIYQRIRTPI
jgi:glycosyltransferase involved in cell wall biosynthesis